MEDNHNNNVTVDNLYLYNIFIKCVLRFSTLTARIKIMYDRDEQQQKKKRYKG